MTNEQNREERESLLLSAMGNVVKTLEPLKYAERRRVLRAVIGFYELSRLEEEIEMTAKQAKHDGITVLPGERQ